MAKRFAVYIDSFSSADDKDSRGRFVYRTYPKVKEIVLRAGRFSSFEASERPGIYMQFFSDPELEITDLGYPWHGVLLKDKHRPQGEGPRRHSPEEMLRSNEVAEP